jgi:hypothetical protein
MPWCFRNKRSVAHQEVFSLETEFAEIQCARPAPDFASPGPKEPFEDERGQKP